MAKVIIVEPNISEDENQQNWKKVQEVLENIAQEINEAS
ncbi:hypothetical protein CLMAG_13790 [Clostridium magnum DSM 2767]|uniref:Uncharacterized protein n=1 Tax=Clostridium magnum DSM 2767 TaxID=1121326 RepID=A0A161XI00_9CLOT|nr:hypothetical protein CLMAG_13790 [Clostridium magnum DSM 2767]